MMRFRQFSFVCALIMTIGGAAFGQHKKNDTTLYRADDKVVNRHNRFPADFIGNWSGMLEWTQAGKSTSQKIPMHLRIQPSTEKTGQYSWHLIFGDSAKDSRPYILKVVDTSTGHWVIDELNDIILDQYWLAGRFSGAFTVQKSTIVNSYWLEEGKLHVEFISYSAKPINTSGKGDQDIPFVDSYELRSFQKAVLRKQ